MEKENDHVEVILLAEGLAQQLARRHCTAARHLHNLVCLVCLVRLVRRVRLVVRRVFLAPRILLVAFYFSLSSCFAALVVCRMVILRRTHPHSRRGFLRASPRHLLALTLTLALAFLFRRPRPLPVPLPLPTMPTASPLTTTSTPSDLATTAATCPWSPTACRSAMPCSSLLKRIPSVNFGRVLLAFILPA